MPDMLFHSWADLGRVLVVGTGAYVGLVFLLRVSGKRTLSKMNAFDLVVTVALGSVFATVLLSSNVALAKGLVALALLIALQFIVAWLSVRSAGVRGLVKAAPRLLFYKGMFFEAAMRHERVSRDEVLAALRAHGTSRLEDAGAVILETDGSLTVTEGSPLSRASALWDVEGVSAD